MIFYYYFFFKDADGELETDTVLKIIDYEILLIQNIIFKQDLHLISNQRRFSLSCHTSHYEAETAM